MREVLLFITLFHIRVNWNLERSSYLLRFTKLGNSQVCIWTHVCLIPKLKFLTMNYYQETRLYDHNLLPDRFRPSPLPGELCSTRYARWVVLNNSADSEQDWAFSTMLASLYPSGSQKVHFQAAHTTNECPLAPIPSASSVSSSTWSNAPAQLTADPIDGGFVTKIFKTPTTERQIYVLTPWIWVGLWLLWQRQ